MNARAHPTLAPESQARQSRPLVEIQRLTWQRALLVAAGGVAAFHLAWAFAPLSALIVGYLYCLCLLAALPTPGKAFCFGLAIGYAVYAPHLAFFWTIFGWPAVALWTVLAFWLGLFVALAWLGWRKLRWLVAALVPFVRSGLECFRSRLSCLR